MCVIHAATTEERLAGQHPIRDDDPDGPVADRLVRSTQVPLISPVRECVDRPVPPFANLRRHQPP